VLTEGDKTSTAGACKDRKEIETSFHLAMGKKGHCWLRVKTRPWKRCRRLSVILIILFLFMCLLWNNIEFRDLYYAVETAQNTYSNADEVLEDVAQNWRGLQKKDVSFSINVANFSCFMMGC
jgi:hypothetical protein